MLLAREIIFLAALRREASKLGSLAFKLSIKNSLDKTELQIVGREGYPSKWKNLLRMERARE